MNKLEIKYSTISWNTMLAQFLKRDLASWLGNVFSTFSHFSSSWKWIAPINKIQKLLSKDIHAIIFLPK